MLRQLSDARPLSSRADDFVVRQNIEAIGIETGNTDHRTKKRRPDPDSISPTWRNGFYVNGKAVRIRLFVPGYVKESISSSK